MNKPLIFDSIDAIHTGGSYTVGADGKATRNDAESGPLPTNAEGAPGPAAELNAAAVGVAPAQPEAAASASATAGTSPPASASTKSSGKTTA